MNQLECLLKIFDNEIRSLISKEKKPRTFNLRRNDEKGYFSDIFKPRGNETFSILYDLKHIEVYYNSYNLVNFYVQARNMTKDILEKIFIYLAHHEYGHSLFYKSSLDYYNFREELRNSSFKNCNTQMRAFSNNILERLFRVLNESFTDYRAKNNRVFPPKNYYNLYFGTFEGFLRYKKQPNDNMRKLAINFNETVLYSSTFFYIFNQWNYLLEKCGENNKTESLKLVYLINTILKMLIRKNLELKEYGNYLIQITLVLNKINYNNLFFTNNLEKDILKELNDFLYSL
ncbi:hypothetical protein LCGC14_1054280 [marine sediment metagenome]|uniref:Uncharacterized protein n=1 Tax=marine sediment metagenome TaxID=412755 RepID=A0A0F9Q608_9ZZZZ